jgi:hypothetical protein
MAAHLIDGVSKREGIVAQKYGRCGTSLATDPISNKNYSPQTNFYEKNLLTTSM